MLRVVTDWEFAYKMMLKPEYEMLMQYPNFYNVAEPWQEEHGLRKEKS